MKRTAAGYGPRVLLYSHDTYGLGHFRRSVAIALAISKRVPSISMLCLTGSPRSHAFNTPANFDVVKLPSTTKDSQGRYIARSLDMPFDRLVELRSRIILETTRSFRPDLVLVDHAPAGMSGELRPTLRALRRELPATRVWLGLRDILDSPERVKQEWNEGWIIPLLTELYDRIFVYGMREVFDPLKEYGVPPQIEARTSFTGYVNNGGPFTSARQIRRTLDLSKQRPLVVVSVGGGGDGDRLLRAFTKAMKIHPKPEFETVVLPGPLLSERKRSRIMVNLAEAPRVKVVPFHDDVPALLAMASVSVSMGGYNSVVEVLASGRRGIVAPRCYPRLEQKVRADRLAQLGFIDALENDDPDPELLRWRIDAQIAAAAKQEPAVLHPFPLSLNGADVVADAVARELVPHEVDTGEAHHTALEAR